MRRIEAEQIESAEGNHLEGPVWDEREQRLLFTDTFAGLVLAAYADGHTELILDVGQRVGSVALREGDGLLVAAEVGLGVTDGSASIDWRFPVLRDEAQMCFNDGKCDPQGRFWGGSVSLTAGQREGHLFRLEPDGHLDVALHGLQLSNGMAWSSDETTFYLADTLARTVWQFKFDPGSGTLLERTPFLVFPEGTLPDGLTIDLADQLWIAEKGTGLVRCYASDGRVRHTISVPSPQVASCAFGGPDYRQLFITTGRSKDLADKYAGRLFVADVPAQGAAPQRFAG